MWHMSSQATDLFVREIDLPRLSFRQLVACQQSTCEIMEYGLWGNLECSSCALDREASVGPAHRICADAVDLRGRNTPAGAQQPDILSLEGTAAGSDEAFLIKYRCDLPVHFASAVQLRDPLP